MLIRARAALGALLLAATSFAEAPPEPAPAATPVEVPAVLPPGARQQLRDTLDGGARRLTPGEEFINAEALFMVNSYLASIAPVIYGAAGTILLPAGVAGMEPGPERTSAFLLVEGLALYNLFGVDDDDMSEGEIFRTNLAAWHGIMLLNHLVHRQVEKRKARDARISVIPLRKGAAIRLAGRF